MNTRNKNLLRMNAGTSFLVAETSFSGTALVIQGPTNRLFAGAMAVLIGCALALFAAICMLPSNVSSGKTVCTAHSAAGMAISVIQPANGGSTNFGNQDPLTVFWDGRCICGVMSSKARRKDPPHASRYPTRAAGIAGQDQSRDRRDRSGVSREVITPRRKGHWQHLREVLVAVPGFHRRSGTHAFRGRVQTGHLHPT